MEKKHNFQIPFPARIALFAAAVIFSAVSGFAQGKPVISVRAESTVEKDRISLGDISEISAVADTRLASLSLGYAPNVGSIREITRSQIALALSAAGFQEGNVELVSPAKVTIRRAGQMVLEGQIREIVEKAIFARLSPDRIEARIVRLDVFQTIQVPAGVLDIRTDTANVRNLFARFSLPLEIRVDGRLIRTHSVGVEIEAFANVLITAKDLPVNSRISEADVKFEKKRLVKSLSSYLLDTTRLRSFVLIKNLSAGSEITSETLAAAVVVKYGDTVSLEAVSGKVTLIIMGEARGSGKIGDRIAVKNLQSGAILQAVVTDEGHARVAF
jgi:flagellar basal body P-ring formation protein FlgA